MRAGPCPSSPACWRKEWPWHACARAPLPCDLHRATINALTASAPAWQARRRRTALHMRRHQAAYGASQRCSAAAAAMASVGRQPARRTPLTRLAIFKCSSSSKRQLRERLIRALASTSPWGFRWQTRPGQPLGPPPPRPPLQLPNPPHPLCRCRRRPAPMGAWPGLATLLKHFAITFKQHQPKGCAHKSDRSERILALAAG